MRRVTLLGAAAISVCLGDIDAAMAESNGDNTPEMPDWCEKALGEAGIEGADEDICVEGDAPTDCAMDHGAGWTNVYDDNDNFRGCACTVAIFCGDSGGGGGDGDDDRDDPPPPPPEEEECPFEGQEKDDDGECVCPDGWEQDPNSGECKDPCADDYCKTQFKDKYEQALGEWKDCRFEVGKAATEICIDDGLFPDGSVADPIDEWEYGRLPYEGPWEIGNMCLDKNHSMDLGDVTYPWGSSAVGKAKRCDDLCYDAWFHGDKDPTTSVSVGASAGPVSIGVTKNEDDDQVWNSLSEYCNEEVLKKKQNEAIGDLLSCRKNHNLTCEGDGLELDLPDTMSPPGAGN